MGLKVIYISSKRAEERELLEHISDVDYSEYCLHIRSNPLQILIRRLLKLTRSVRMSAPDLILIESAGLYSLYAVVGKSLLKIPYLIRVKGNPWAEYEEIKFPIPIKEKIAKWINWQASSLLFKNADGFLPISKSVKKSIFANVGEDKPAYVVKIPLSVRQSCSEAFDEANEKSYSVLTVTNFNYWQKVEPLLELIPVVASTLAEKGISWNILGDGHFLERFRGELSSFGEFSNVHLVGKSNPVPYYHSALCMLYFSGLDGLPNVLLESMHYGLPVMMNEDCPASEFIEHGVNGILISRSKPEAVISYIDNLLDDQELRRMYARNGKQDVKSLFTVARIAHELEDALVSFSLTV